MLSSPYEYRELSKNTNNETGFRRYNTPDGEKLPSVTTILAQTADPEEGEATYCTCPSPQAHFQGAT